MASGIPEAFYRICTLDGVCQTGVSPTVRLRGKAPAENSLGAKMSSQGTQLTLLGAFFSSINQIK